VRAQDCPIAATERVAGVRKRRARSLLDPRRLSPDFSLAYSGLSDAYLWAGYNEGFITAAAARPRAKDAAERAVVLDGQSAEAHTSLAVFKLFYDYDWLGCEREFRQAFSLNPNYAFAHDQFGMALGFQGRFAEAIAEGARAIELDPLSPQILVDATMPFIFQRDVKGAKALARRAMELDPAFFFPVMVEGWADLDAGHYRDALPALKRARHLGYCRGTCDVRSLEMKSIEVIGLSMRDVGYFSTNPCRLYRD
jgi:tetratricopeptide (TPR) repeat protein